VDRLYSKLSNTQLTSIIVDDRTPRDAVLYMTQYNDRISPCPIQRNKLVYGDENSRLQSSYLLIYDPIAPYTVTKIYDLNTELYELTKYNRI